MPASSRAWTSRSQTSRDRALRNSRDETHSPPTTRRLTLNAFPSSSNPLPQARPEPGITFEKWGGNIRDEVGRAPNKSPQLESPGIITAGSPPGPLTVGIQRLATNGFSYLPLRKLGETTFRYMPLNQKHNEIRLLRLLPGYTSNIHCEILRTSLNSPEKYMAISYAWGDCEDTRTIFLEGHAFPVTESLWHSLDKLRLPTDEVILWVDAVCIDQQTTHERNLQVQAMTSIYSKADSMSIWLGPETEDSKLAMDLLVELHQLREASENARITEIINMPSRSRGFRAIVSLFTREYWDRLWVVQEVHNSSSITVHCGPGALPWSVFASATDLFKEHKPDLIRAFMGRFYSNGLRGSFPWEIYLCYHGPGLLSRPSVLGITGFLRTLLAHRSKRCTEPRDRVYGVLGVVSEEVRTQFPVDYNISLVEVYTNVVDYLLMKNQILDVICASIHFPKHQSIERLPSWVPDWSNDPHVGPVALLNPRFASHRHIPAIYSFANRRRELTISAISLGTVANCGMSLWSPVDMNAVAMAFINWRLILMDEKGPDNIEAHEDFCRTLSADRTSDRWSSKEWMEWIYQSFGSMLGEAYPRLALDAQLKFYTSKSTPISTGLREQTFTDFIIPVFADRRFFLTNTGLLCLGPGCANVGDIICVPLGCSTPIILREYGQCYLYVGDAYVDGYMYGRAIDEWESGQRKLQSFVLQ